MALTVFVGRTGIYLGIQWKSWKIIITAMGGNRQKSFGNKNASHIGDDQQKSFGNKNASHIGDDQQKSFGNKNASHIDDVGLIYGYFLVGVVWLAVCYDDYVERVL